MLGRRTATVVTTLGHVNVGLATSNVTHDDVPPGFIIDRTIIIRVNACCVAVFSEQTQQSPTVAVAKFAWQMVHLSAARSGCSTIKSFLCDQSALPSVFSQSYSDRVITNDERKIMLRCLATAFVNSVFCTRCIRTIFRK
jgi:hypothetical protein